MTKKVIDIVRLYKFNVETEQNFSFGTWRSRQHIFIKLGSNNRSGWGECILSVNKPENNLFEAAGCFSALKGKTFSEAFALVREKFGIWRHSFTEMAELALIDLRGKLAQKSAVELLVLEGVKPVPGVYTILSKNPAEVREKAAVAAASRRDRYIKVKLFGDTETDRSIIAAVRSVSPRERCFLLGDVNCGYSNALDFSVEKLGIQLIMLHTAGLDACEDPAEMRPEAWAELQKFVDPLPLISDYPMRPARKAIKTFSASSSRIFNIHPDLTGSVLDAVALAEKIKKEKGSLMIGDDSLIGPGCAAWQQLAIGLGADWVEAVEKDGASDFYREALLESGIGYGDGFFNLERSRGGFGIELDERTLKKHATQILEV